VPLLSPPLVQKRRLRIPEDDNSTSSASSAAAAVAAAARELQQLLEEGLKRVREGGGEGRTTSVAVEWFLRRRVGDCGGRS
jgi:hypothetical protein